MEKQCAPKPVPRQLLQFQANRKRELERTAMQRLVANELVQYAAVQQTPKKKMRTGRYDVHWEGEEIAEAEALNRGESVDRMRKPFVIVSTAEFLDLRNDGGTIVNPWLDDENYTEETAQRNEDDDWSGMKFGSVVALRDREFARN